MSAPTMTCPTLFTANQQKWYTQLFANAIAHADLKQSARFSSRAGYERLFHGCEREAKASTRCSC